jgi:tetratricopeptide (TPR) repeat protein
MPEAVIFREKISIPTYDLYPPDPSPVFYEMRNHQGTRGNMYPYRMIDSYRNSFSPREYDAIRLENEYIRVVVLPELGGRIYEGYNKKLDYHFVYKNNIIKPAMIGLCGAWLSGGIEFNWPTHHRPTTFMPVDALIEECGDGSKTVWLGETEALYGLKNLIGISIKPGSASITVKSRVYNPTPKAQTFHWWSNLAVHTNESYQLKFPPDIDYITFHYKNVVSEFPMVRGEFATYDFGQEGADITWYRNIPSLASFFIFNSNYNFMGGYDHGKKKGTVHVADRHVSPGKKFFTWGTNSFGQTWQKNLTDKDGPYIEIMTGCYTDNQPDFCFIAPDETKTFEQTWYAIDNLPDIKNANHDGAISLGVEGTSIILGFNTTAVQTNARVQLSAGDKIIFEKIADIEPGIPFTAAVDNTAKFSIHDLRAALYDKSGALIVDYQSRPPYFEGKELPRVHYPSRKPADIPTVEELYLEGLHLEQYHHPLLKAADWYTEGLMRDPGDYRCNNAMGLMAMKAGDFRKAADFFRKSVARIIARNYNPQDGEPHYNLALALSFLGEEENSINYFRKAAWCAAWKAPALLGAASLYMKRKEYPDALKCAREALAYNRDSLRLRLVLSSALRKNGLPKEAEILAKETLLFDPLNLAAYFESAFTGGREGPDRQKIDNIIRGRNSSPLELTGLYIDLGLYNEALTVLSYCTEAPLICIYRAFVLYHSGFAREAVEELKKAARSGSDFVFPARDREIAILSLATDLYKEGALASYYLGSLYYGRRNRQMAIIHWEEAVRRDAAYYPAHRCLAIAYHDEKNDRIGALREMEKAFFLHKDARFLYELVQISKVNKKTVKERIRLLEDNTDLLDLRDDLFKEYITLLNLDGRFNDAAVNLKNHFFHPYEGGEGILVREHVITYISLGRDALKEGAIEKSVEFFNFALSYPENYGEGRRYKTHEAHIYYHLGIAWEKADEAVKARDYFTHAAEEDDDAEESGACKVLALRKLGQIAAAAEVCKKMQIFAEEIGKDPDAVPYYGNFPAGQPFEQSMKKVNVIRSLTAEFYGSLGLGDSVRAGKAREKIAEQGDVSPWFDIITSSIKEL